VVFIVAYYAWSILMHEVGHLAVCMTFIQLFVWHSSSCLYDIHPVCITL